MKNPIKGILVASLALLAAESAQAQQFTMKISTPTIGDINVEWMKLFKQGVEARANGRIKVELYPASQLGSMASTIDGTMLGTIEAAFVASGFLVGIEPRYQLFDAVGIFDGINHGQLIFNDPEVRKRMATFGSAKGVEPLTTFVHSDNVLIVRKPVNTLADFKGLKVRVYSTPMQIEAVKKLGASPIPMTLGEVLPAIQNGTIDGAITGNTILTAFKYYDAAKYAVYLPSFSTVAAAIVNKAWLASLPADLRAILAEEVHKADTAAAAWGAQDVERSKKAWEQNGGLNISLPAAEQKQFIDDVTASIMPVINANPQMKVDYQVFMAAAQKYRK
jgi:TRAP-type C4-dicarboxylate transport system substrate-binding protein